MQTQQRALVYAGMEKWVRTQAMGAWEPCGCECLASQEEGVTRGRLKTFQALTFPLALKRYVVTSGAVGA